MATRTVSLAKGDGQIVTATWEGLLQTSGDDGAPVHMGNVDGLTVQMVGTLGTGGEVTMQGSNNGTDWGTLQDPGGNSVILDAIGAMFLIGNRPLYIRPSVTGGDGDTDVDVIMVGMRKGT